VAIALPISPTLARPTGSASPSVELVANERHFARVIVDGVLRAAVSVDVMTADFKAMLVPVDKRSRRAQSIVDVFRGLAEKGVEIRILHAGVPSSAALLELRKALPERLTIRRCPRLHSKAVILDSRSMYLGSANLTGAGLGAKADGRRNFELGIWTTSATLIEPVLDEFNQLWEGNCCKACKRKDVCPVPLEEPEL
jgi:phosphatidylserine/phosphatidylglycerophosphate/cardiolipin synthase-like enzyme